MTSRILLAVFLLIGVYEVVAQRDCHDRRSDCHKFLDRCFHPNHYFQCPVSCGGCHDHCRDDDVACLGFSEQCFFSKGANKCSHYLCARHVEDAKVHVETNGCLIMYVMLLDNKVIAEHRAQSLKL
nr:uncharacterized protein LOC121131210 [Lepeophtheirus salmonis]